MPQNKTQKILIIKLGALGDMVQALGPMRAIKAYHPDAEFTILTTFPYVDLLTRTKLFDHIWVDHRPKWFDVGGWHDLISKLNHGHFSRVYDLQNNDRTGFYFRLMSPKPEWVGIAPGASHRNISPDRSAGLAFYGHVQTLNLAGIQDIQIDDLSWMTSDLSVYSLPARYALIIPGSSARHVQKRWPASFFAEACAFLQRHHITPVLIGSSDEQDVLDNISRLNPDCIHLGGKTSLFDLPALARGAVLALGNDTGPLHLMAPTGCPSLVLFSKHSQPKKHAPLGKKVTTIEEDDLNKLSVQKVTDSLTRLMSS
ncbi:MAG: glycosyltransferase family 9 protein [Alphaproteobacteria bacterium]|nr:glycosyltransferase family 9 protein [Alphaproteobacteria bacterium]